MRHTRHIALLTALLLLLSGCSLPGAAALFPRASETSPGDSLVVYRLAASEESGELIRAEQLPSAAGDAASDIGQLLAFFTGAPADVGMRSALPGGVTVEDWSRDNGVVTLELSEAFSELTPMEQTVSAFCAVLTLCQLDGVEAVTIVSGGQTLFSGLMPEDALLDATDTDPYVRQLRLYFADADGRYLLSEYHSLTLDEETSPERYVIEELLRGPNNGELRGTIPAGTTLLSCVTEDGVCTVDLSEAFYENRPETAAGERLTVYSIVNSLTALSGVDSVRILVGGQPIETYLYRSLADPLTRYDQAIGPVSAPKGEFDADLYLALPGLTEIAPLPFRVSETDYESRAEAVLEALLSASEPGYPEVFSGTGSVMAVAVQGAACTVDLSESFFVSLPEDARETAVRSMAATLCALPGVNAVRFTVGGEDAVFDGTDWSGPWRAADSAA